MLTLFLKILSSGVILIFVATATQLPGFSIGRLANVENFFNVNTFFKCKLNISVCINEHSLHLRSQLLKISRLFASPVLQRRF